MTRTYPEAPVCAVGAIVFRGDAVLLIQRAKTTGARANGLFPAERCALVKL